MENIIQFPKQAAVKADAWAEYEHILKRELHGLFVLNADPQEILTSIMARMRKIFERCSELQLSGSVTLSSPDASPEQCEFLKAQVEAAISQAYPGILSQFLSRWPAWKRIFISCKKQ